MSLHALSSHTGGSVSGRARPVPWSPGARPERRARRRLAALGALLLTLTAPPAAVLVVPDAVCDVVPAAAQALDLGAGGVPALLRATGLSLPALLVAVPLGAGAARRFPALGVLAAGLAVLLAGLGTARLADSVALAGTVRAAQGAGAGIVLPASLVLVWERRSRALAALWAGVLAGMLIIAMPLALRAVPPGDAARDWRDALAPYPWPALAAAVAAAAHLLLRGRGPSALPAARLAERGQLLLPLAPAAGFAFLAVVAAHAWSPGARLVVAGLALTALLGLALTARRDATAGSPFGCAVVMIAAGALCHPVAGPLAGLAAAGAHGRDAAVPLLPFAAAAAAAVLAALGSTRVPARRAVRAGCFLVAVAVPLGLTADVHDRWTMLGPLVLLGAGAGAALAASLRDAGVGAALFGLSLCFPAVLAGQLIVLSLQAARLERLRPASDAERTRALLDGYHGWLVVAAAAAVLLAAVAAAPPGRSAAASRAR
ncbi:hypothetical protein [Actinomadura decatromicini]|uniref:MFS transporter n=1 Tax=Actinomadura decatromicini TaxID=2604572 RepID=A0A5D3FVY0_9ACTN|nr:hypothetical protein [Actinomadura decatromicini]TYK52264.1 hypothetical protein FXF68_00160 [Actinomadura decatromicini]